MTLNVIVNFVVSACVSTLIGLYVAKHIRGSSRNEARFFIVLGGLFGAITVFPVNYVFPLDSVPLRAVFAMIACMCSLLQVAWAFNQESNRVRVLLTQSRNVQKYLLDNKGKLRRSNGIIRFSDLQLAIQNAVDGMERYYLRLIVANLDDIGRSRKSVKVIEGMPHYQLHSFGIGQVSAPSFDPANYQIHEEDIETFPAAVAEKHASWQ